MESPYLSRPSVTGYGSGRDEFLSPSLSSISSPSSLHKSRDSRDSRDPVSGHTVVLEIRISGRLSMCQSIDQFDLFRGICLLISDSGEIWLVYPPVSHLPGRTDSKGADCGL